MPVKTPAYSVLSHVYNHIMKKVRYDLWAEYLYSIVESHLPEEYIGLELAAGNLNFTNCLHEYLTDIIATDISASMLKSDKKDLFPKVCCDMINLPFFMEFDLIYSTFDSINYITNKKKLQKHFNEVKRCLTPGGIYAFDASLEKNSLIHAREGNKKGTVDGYRYIQKSEYDPVKKIHKNYFRIYSGDDVVYNEVHKQKVYPFETYFELIENAGLFVVKCFEAFNYNDGTPESERIQFIVKKKN